jgi:two-component system response regulator AtoC
MSGRVLIVDDDPSTCDLLDASLRRRGFDTLSRTAAAEGLAALAVGDFDVVLTDLNMRGMNGIELCTRIVANRPDVPVIVVTAFGSLETAVAAIRAGAYDFITKPFEIDAIELTLQRALQQRALREEVKRLRSALDQSRRFDDLLGTSAAMREVFELMERVAVAEAAVLITGETGTGKEIVARALHRRSHRHEGPFVSVNCAAVPEPLLESDLFGHVRGAFTDARAERRGMFLHADGGTLFLDEIGDMPLSLQPKLLRALQDHTVRPVGSDQEVAGDVRIVAATNRDLDAAVEEGRFRADLYFRVNVLHIDLPPLRARGSDVLLLAQHFLERCAARADKHPLSLSPAVAEKLLAYTWPGNVRELENCIERAVALSRYSQIMVEDLPQRIRNHATTDVIVAGTDPSELVSMEEVERRYILRVLEAVGGNKTLAAQVLGFDRKTLYRKLERYAQATDANPKPAP